MQEQKEVQERFVVFISKIVKGSNYNIIGNVLDLFMSLYNKENMPLLELFNSYLLVKILDSVNYVSLEVFHSVIDFLNSNIKNSIIESLKTKYNEISFTNNIISWINTFLANISRETTLEIPYKEEIYNLLISFFCSFTLHDFKSDYFLVLQNLQNIEVQIHICEILISRSNLYEFRSDIDILINHKIKEINDISEIDLYSSPFILLLVNRTSNFNRLSFYLDFIVENIKMNNKIKEYIEILYNTLNNISNKHSIVQFFPYILRAAYLKPTKYLSTETFSIIKTIKTDKFNKILILFILKYPELQDSVIQMLLFKNNSTITQLNSFSIKLMQEIVENNRDIKEYQNIVNFIIYEIMSVDLCNYLLKHIIRNRENGHHSYILNKFILLFNRPIKHPYMKLNRKAKIEYSFSVNSFTVSLWISNIPSRKTKLMRINDLDVYINSSVIKIFKNGKRTSVIIYEDRNDWLLFTVSNNKKIVKIFINDSINISLNEEFENSTGTVKFTFYSKLHYNSIHLYSRPFINNLLYTYGPHFSKRKLNLSLYPDLLYIIPNLYKISNIIEEENEIALEHIKSQIPPNIIDILELLGGFKILIPFLVNINSKEEFKLAYGLMLSFLNCTVTNTNKTNLFKELSLCFSIIKIHSKKEWFSEEIMDYLIDLFKLETRSKYERKHIILIDYFIVFLFNINFYQYLSNTSKKRCFELILSNCSNIRFYSFYNDYLTKIKHTKNDLLFLILYSGDTELFILYCNFFDFTLSRNQNSKLSKEFFQLFTYCINTEEEDFYGYRTEIIAMLFFDFILKIFINNREIFTKNIIQYISFDVIISSFKCNCNVKKKLELFKMFIYLFKSIPKLHDDFDDVFRKDLLIFSMTPLFKEEEFLQFFSIVFFIDDLNCDSVDLKDSKESLYFWKSEVFFTIFIQIMNTQLTESDEKSNLFIEFLGRLTIYIENIEYLLLFSKQSYLDPILELYSHINQIIMQNHCSKQQVLSEISKYFSKVFENLVKNKIDPIIISEYMEYTLTNRFFSTYKSFSHLVIESYGEVFEYVHITLNEDLFFSLFSLFIYINIEMNSKNLIYLKYIDQYISSKGKLRQQYLLLYHEIILSDLRISLNSNEYSSFLMILNEISNNLLKYHFYDSKEYKCKYFQILYKWLLIASKEVKNGIYIFFDSINTFTEVPPDYMQALIDYITDSNENNTTRIESIINCLNSEYPIEINSLYQSPIRRTVDPETDNLYNEIVSNYKRLNKRKMKTIKCVEDSFIFKTFNYCNKILKKVLNDKSIWKLFGDGYSRDSKEPIVHYKLSSILRSDNYIPYRMVVNYNSMFKNKNEEYRNTYFINVLRDSRCFETNLTIKDIILLFINHKDLPLIKTNNIRFIFNIHKVYKFKAVKSTLIITEGSIYIITKSTYKQRQFNFIKKITDTKCHRIKFNSLKMVIPSRYHLSLSSLSLFTSKSKNYCIVFDDSENYELFVSYLFTSKNVGNLLPFPPIHLNYEYNNQVAMFYQQKWLKGEITNFDYLLFLNMWSGRSFEDLGHYPVVPWVINFNIIEDLSLSNLNNFRNLSKPVGALNGERLEEFKRKFESIKLLNDETNIPYFYGTFYSNSGYIIHYLTRLYPFSKYHLKFQDGSFDAADRLFFSIKDTWELSSQLCSQVFTNF